MADRNPRVIRKYANRRLYDTADKRYVNLEDVAEFIRRGEDVRVEDARTGEDVTRVVLTQIILGDARDRPAGLPLELLRQLILATDRAGQEFIMWYLHSAFEAYRKVQESVQSGLSDVRSAALSPLGMMKSLLTPAAESAEVAGLRRRLADLEAQFTASPRRKSARRKRAE